MVLVSIKQKKYLALLILASLVFLAFSFQYAIADDDEWKRIYIPELEISIQLPADNITLYKDMPVDSEFLASANIDYQDVMDYFYVLGLNLAQFESYWSDGHLSLMIKSYGYGKGENDIDASAIYHQEKIKEIENDLDNCVLIGYRDLTINDKNYVAIDYTLSDYEFYTCSTVVAGRYYDFSIAGSNMLSDEDKTTLERIISQVMYYPKQAETREAQQFGDVSIDMPENWICEYKSESYIKYTSNDSGVFIVGHAIKSGTHEEDDGIDLLNQETNKYKCYTRIMTIESDITDSQIPFRNITNLYLLVGNIPMNCSYVEIVGNHWDQIFSIFGPNVFRTSEAYNTFLSSIQLLDDSNEDDYFIVQDPIIDNERAIFLDGSLSIALNSGDYYGLTRNNSFHDSFLAEKGITSSSADNYLNTCRYDYGWRRKYVDNCIAYLKIRENAYDNNINFPTFDEEKIYSFLAAFFPYQSNNAIVNHENMKYVQYQIDGRSEMMTVINGNELVLGVDFQLNQYNIDQANDMLQDIIKTIQISNIGK